MGPAGEGVRGKGADALPLPCRLAALPSWRAQPPRPAQAREMIPPALKSLLLPHLPVACPPQPDGQAAVHPQSFTDASQEEAPWGECVCYRPNPQQRFVLKPQGLFRDLTLKMNGVGSNPDSPGSDLRTWCKPLSLSTPFPPLCAWIVSSQQCPPLPTTHRCQLLSLWA